jgi:K+ transporter
MDCMQQTQEDAVFDLRIFFDVVSLINWALHLIIQTKYVLFFFVLVM